MLLANSYLLFDVNVDMILFIYLNACFEDHMKNEDLYVLCIMYYLNPVNRFGDFTNALKEKYRFALLCKIF